MACVERVYFDCWEEDVEEGDVGLVVMVVLGMSGMRWLVVSLVSCGFRRESVVVTVGVVRMDGVAVVLSSTNPVVDVVVEREDPPRKEASCRRNGEWMFVCGTHSWMAFGLKNPPVGRILLFPTDGADDGDGVVC